MSWARRRRGPAARPGAGRPGWVLVALPAYALFTSVYSWGPSVLPAPGALGWKALAALAETGTAALPPGRVRPASGGAVALMLSLLEGTRAARFIPSPIALAVAFLVPATISGAVALGSLVWLILYRRPPADAERIASSAAAGDRGGIDHGAAGGRVDRAGGVEPGGRLACHPQLAREGYCSRVAGPARGKARRQGWSMAAARFMSLSQAARQALRASSVFPSERRHSA